MAGICATLVEVEQHNNLVVDCWVQYVTPGILALGASKMKYSCNDTKSLLYLLDQHSCQQIQGVIRALLDHPKNV